MDMNHCKNFLLVANSFHFSFFFFMVFDLHVLIFIVALLCFSFLITRPPPSPASPCLSMTSPVSPFLSISPCLSLPLYASLPSHPELPPASLPSYPLPTPASLPFYHSLPQPSLPSLPPFPPSLSLSLTQFAIILTQNATAQKGQHTRRSSLASM